MRNYIILNNQRSDEISGLIIQELAPISKPLQRTQVETIDGRDGDIVTPLGYAAYDKKITIGLYGDFDINEIIAYFATQGTAIFSNEPDKYYNYQILDQIDYERLVRFRVATVTMHVQPFKYSATEGTITVDASDTVSGEGSDIALDGTAEAPFNVLRYKGNATQDGTPTPDSPQPISTVTGAQNIKVTGKNLWDNFEPSTKSASITWTPTDNGGTFINTGTWSTGLVWNYTLDTTQQYTVQLSTPSDVPLYFYVRSYTDDTYTTESTRYVQEGRGNISRTFQPDTPYVRLFFWNGQAINDGVSVQNMMLELGNSASSYESYQGQEFPIDLGSIELAKVGDYADEPVKVGDTWYIRRAVGKVVLDGTTAITSTATSAGNSDMAYAYTNAYDNVMLGGVGALCDKLSYIGSINTSTASSNELFSVVSDWAHLRFHIKKSRLSAVTIQGFKDWLGSETPTVYYALATPTDEEITDQDLIDALDEFYGQAHSYKGHTQITATAADGNAPAVLSVEVGEDNESTVTNAGNTTSRPILTIYGQGNIGVYINDVEVLDIALGDEQYITLDSTEMDAYKDSPANLKNRLVTGDYSKLALNAGANKIRFTGNVTKYEISKYSRWL